MKYKYEGLFISSAWLWGLENKFLCVRIADNKNNIGLYAYKRYKLRDMIKFFRQQVRQEEILDYIKNL